MKYQNKENREVANRKTKPLRIPQTKSKKNCPHEDCLDPEVCSGLFRCKELK